MKHKAGADVSTGGTFLKEPGTYHFCVTDAEENPTNKKTGALVDNGAFRIDLEVLDGTVSGQEHKTCDMLFFHPKPSDKNEGAFARKKIDRCLLALNLMTDAQLGTDVDVDMKMAVGRQFIAKMELDNDGKFLQLAFSDIYHVDDPAVKTIPKNESALKLIPASMRKIGEQPKSPSKPTANGQSKSSGAGTTEKAAEKAGAAPARGAAGDEWGL